VEDRLERLQRRLHAYERSTARALRQLRDLQSGAGASACQPIEEPSASSEIGFVPPDSSETPEDRAIPSSEPATLIALIPDPRPLTPKQIGFLPPNSPAPSGPEPPSTPLLG
jgi:hypothetical protein